MVWLLGTNSSIALFALYLLWLKSNVALAAILGLCVMLGFWIAVVTRDLYAGALTDVGGIEGTILGFEANTFSFGFVTAFLLIGLLLEKRSR